MIGLAMQPRSRARYLAPVALAAVLVGTYLVVHTGLAQKHPRIHHVRRASGIRRRYARTRYYSVQTGDNLTTISTKTGLAIGQLETLNPNIDPNSLQTGQRLRLRR
jgi:LysM domain